MKFILNESVKFVLEERFVLHEADDTSPEIVTTLKWLQILLDNVGEGSDTSKKIQAYLEACAKGEPLAAPTVTNPTEDSNWKNLESEAKKLESMTRVPLEGQSIDKQKNELIEIGKQLGVYLTRLSAVINANKDQIKKNLDKAVKTLTALQKSLPKTPGDSFSEKDSSKILPQIKQLPEGLSQIKDALQKYLDTSTQQLNSSKIGTFRTSCNETATFFKTTNSKQFKIVKLKRPNAEMERQETIKKLKLFSDSALKEFQAAISEALKAAKDLEPYDKENVAKILANIEAYSKKVKAIKDKFEAILKCEVYADAPKAEDEAVAEDWQSKFLKTPDSSKHLIIEAFINETWSYNAPKVLPIGAEIMAACKAYGFDMDGPNVNPLLHFINEIYLPYGLTDKQYRAIHNATAGKLLKKEDFLKTGALGNGNLIFCKALYKLDEKVITGYLAKQASLLRASTKPKKFSTVADMAFGALYKIDLEKNPPKDAATQDSAGLSLRTLSEISRLEAEWLGKASDISDEDAVIPDDELVANVIKAGKDTAVEIMVALALKFSSAADVSTTASKCSEAKTMLETPMSPVKMIKLLSTASTYIPKKFTAAQAVKLITGLIESDKLKLTKV